MPPKYGELLIDDVIENAIDFWLESKQREPEQDDFDFDKD